MQINNMKYEDTNEQSHTQRVVRIQNVVVTQQIKVIVTSPGF